MINTFMSFYLKRKKNYFKIYHTSCVHNFFVIKRKTFFYVKIMKIKCISLYIISPCLYLSHSISLSFSMYWQNQFWLVPHSLTVQWALQFRVFDFANLVYERISLKSLVKAAFEIVPLFECLCDSGYRFS